ncbi:hypothetical protein QBC33DRAFT_516465 [Phialemonium atrogriseum]|uniref:Uncharacterized protein n=1 Tax=Phialemonium atrogriseum TaxID=1093897 RepID=A0AAJ0FME9_9PEZI|nr:uncharacterized protein QBC33DRAFT_516465 [Phialemonium atrogriseum]KAK1766065.1 hypothetical protein QBC33DRAFT_516465 [Phialemonium atrogriseum]
MPPPASSTLTQPVLQVPVMIEGPRDSLKDSLKDKQSATQSSLALRMTRDSSQFIVAPSLVVPVSPQNTIDNALSNFLHKFRLLINYTASTSRVFERKASFLRSNLVSIDIKHPRAKALLQIEDLWDVPAADAAIVKPLKAEQGIPGLHIARQRFYQDPKNKKSYLLARPFEQLGDRIIHSAWKIQNVVYKISIPRKLSNLSNKVNDNLLLPSSPDPRLDASIELIQSMIATHTLVARCTAKVKRSLDIAEAAVDTFLSRIEQGLHRAVATIVSRHCPALDQQPKLQERICSITRGLLRKAEDLLLRHGSRYVDLGEQPPGATASAFPSSSAAVEGRQGFLSWLFGTKQGRREDGQANRGNTTPFYLDQHSCSHLHESSFNPPRNLRWDYREPKSSGPVPLAPLILIRPVYSPFPDDDPRSHHHPFPFSHPALLNTHCTNLILPTLTSPSAAATHHPPCNVAAALHTHRKALSSIALSIAQACLTSRRINHLRAYGNEMRAQADRMGYTLARVVAR